MIFVITNVPTFIIVIFYSRYARSAAGMYQTQVYSTITFRRLPNLVRTRKIEKNNIEIINVDNLIAIVRTDFVVDIGFKSVLRALF